MRYTCVQALLRPLWEQEACRVRWCLVRCVIKLNSNPWLIHFSANSPFKTASMRLKISTQPRPHTHVTHRCSETEILRWKHEDSEFRWTFLLTTFFVYMLVIQIIPQCVIGGRVVLKLHMKHRKCFFDPFFILFIQSRSVSLTESPVEKVQCSQSPWPFLPIEFVNMKQQGVVRCGFFFCLVSFFCNQTGLGHDNRFMCECWKKNNSDTIS